MKRCISVFIGWLIVSAMAMAQQWQWPVSGMTPGSNVLYSPQNYIDKELNFCSLFIGGKEGDEIVAPFEGKVDHISLTYFDNLVTVRSSGVDMSRDFYTERNEFAKGSAGDIKPQYVSHSIAIKDSDGRQIVINGLELDRQFRSGETVKKGEKLGTMRYSYKNVPEPSIMIRVQNKSKVADPMTPFGLKSTFKEPEPMVQVKSLSPEQAKEDFNIIMDAIIDCYPSLDEHMTLDEFEAYRREQLELLNDTISMEDFMTLMRRTDGMVHDSHISFWPLWRISDIEYWDFDIGRVGDGLRVVRATEDFADYLNREVVSVDGMSVDSLLQKTVRFIGGYDANVEDFVKYHQLIYLTSTYISNTPGVADDRGYTVTFDNGDTLRVNRHKWNGERVVLKPNIYDFARINYYRGKNFDLKMLNDSTAYIGLSTFFIDDVSVDSIQDFIHKNLNTPHLIVDVRNNSGGSMDVASKLLSYCSDRPYATLRQFSKVNRHRFSSMSHSDNYFSVDDDIFGDDYVERDGFEGLYSEGNLSVIMPDSVTAYGGKLYVLVNEHSASAATLFPGNVMRANRGVIIGRETQTAYGYMTALKFIDIRLPHSSIIWRLPFVKLVFDETESPRLPHGRGVVPDVYVPISYEEVAFTDGDAILNRALQMIADGEYLDDNPFEEENLNIESGLTKTIIISVLALVLIAGIVIVLLRRRN